MACTEIIPCTCGRPAGHDPIGQFHPDGRVRGSAEPTPGRCSSLLRKSCPPRYCRNGKDLDPITGRCRFHGKNTPIIHGRRRKYQPAHAIAFYDEAQSPQAKQIDDELAGMDADISELTDALRTGDGAVALAALRAAVRAAQEEGKTEVDIARKEGRDIPTELPPGAVWAADLATLIDSASAYQSTKRQLQQLRLAKGKLRDVLTRQQAAHSITPAEIGKLMVDIQAILAFILTPSQQRDFERRAMAANPLLSYVPWRTP